MLKKLNRSFIIYLTISSLLFIFIFRDLVFNISTNLIDWRDYALLVWVINHFVDVIKNLEFNNIFNGNSFYPLKGTLLFSDLLWPQTIISLFFSVFTKNIVTQFNLTFLSTLLLNSISIYLFWKTIFKKQTNILFASFLTNFSPFFFLQLSHFQMISYWPFFFALSYLFKNKKNLKDNLFVGLFLSIQFYAAVYWAIFLLTVIGIYFLVQLIRKKEFVNILKSIITIGVFFLILVGPILFKYLQVKKAYKINRNYSEYVNYSAQMSDYFFNGSYHSFISDSKIFGKINRLNHHSIGEIAGSPSLVVIFLSLIGILIIQKNKEQLFFSVSIKEKDLFFLLLTLTGLIFSLGPRLSFNGNYLAIPLPFSLALKYLIIFDPIRATARFSALFYIGLIYFSVKGLSKLSNKINIKNFLIMPLALVIFLLEIVPINYRTESNQYYPKVYKEIEKECANDKVLLEYPFEQDNKDSNIVTNLKYKASQLPASLNHRCNLVNGYAGFDPQEYSNYIINFNTALRATDSALLVDTITQKDIDFIKVNKKYLSNDKLQQLDKIDFYNKFGTIIYDDKEFSLIKIEKNYNE